MRGREKIDGIRSVKRDKVEVLGQSQGRKRNVNSLDVKNQKHKKKTGNLN